MKKNLIISKNKNNKLSKINLKKDILQVNK
jgi:hypothetical protein